MAPVREGVILPIVWPGATATIAHADPEIVSPGGEADLSRGDDLPGTVTQDHIAIDFEVRIVIILFRESDEQIRSGRIIQFAGVAGAAVSTEGLPGIHSGNCRIDEGGLVKVIQWVSPAGGIHKLLATAVGECEGRGSRHGDGAGSGGRVRGQHGGICTVDDQTSRIGAGA